MTDSAHNPYLPFNHQHYRPARHDFLPKEYRSDLPLRAKSVSLLERPRSQYGRPVKSAEYPRLRTQKLVFHPRPQSAAAPRTRNPRKVLVKQQNRTPVQKVPCTVSVQTLTLPMRYVDNPKAGLSTAKERPVLCNHDTDARKTKSSNPLKQVSNDRKPCEACASERETANKLLLQISEAEQVEDFERILNSNAILWERARRNVWRSVPPNAPSATLVPRPRSSYSLHAVSRAYHHLHQRHSDSLQPLIDQYRRAAADVTPYTTQSLLGADWYENLNDLSAFYDDDNVLKQEIEAITDKVIDNEVKADVEQTPSKHYNVNLADLIGLHVNGESLSPVPHHDRFSPDVDAEREEWLAPSMSADDNRIEQRECVDELAQNLNSVKIDEDTKLPTITFSNCYENCPRVEPANNSEAAALLAVPSVESDEARPPIM